ncbi:hypothetical protein [Pseudomonas orientalis]|uniref:hypothetical protein n=1 Tax=Pseudomonas orientalis TaxID=76758 RepID=UPI001300097C|nr:hypothetical protein [Pseudomonas orientalis]
MKNSIITILEQAKLSLREIHPEGEFDNARRWYPSERCECCDYIRTPSRAHPFSLMVHARTLEHVACQNDANIEDVKRIKKYLNQVSKGIFLQAFNTLNPEQRKVALAEFNVNLTNEKTNRKYKISAEEASDLIKDQFENINSPSGLFLCLYYFRTPLLPHSYPIPTPPVPQSKDLHKCYDY